MKPWSLLDTDFFRRLSNEPDTHGEFKTILIAVSGVSACLVILPGLILVWKMDSRSEAKKRKRLLKRKSFCLACQKDLNDLEHDGWSSVL